jgi:hypothetical protein
MGRHEDLLQHSEPNLKSGPLSSARRCPGSHRRPRGSEARRAAALELAAGPARGPGRLARSAATAVFTGWLRCASTSSSPSTSLPSCSGWEKWGLVIGETFRPRSTEKTREPSRRDGSRTMDGWELLIRGRGRQRPAWTNHPAPRGPNPSTARLARRGREARLTRSLCPPQCRGPRRSRSRGGPGQHGRNSRGDERDHRGAGQEARRYGACSIGAAGTAVAD